MAEAAVVVAHALEILEICFTVFFLGSMVYLSGIKVDRQ